MFLFRFRVKLKKSMSGCLICHYCVSHDLGEDHVGPDVETEVGTCSTSGLKYKVLWAASKLNERLPTQKKILHSQKRRNILILPCWKKKKVSLLLKASEEKVFGTYPSNLLKMRSIFLEIGECSIEIPGEADVQYRIMLNLARQDNTFSNSDIHAGRCQNNPGWLCWEQKHQLLDSCIAELCLLLIFYHVLQMWLMTVDSNYAAGL